MNKKFLAMLGTIALLSACETASQKVVSGTAATSSSSGSTSGSTSSSVDKKQVYLPKLNKQLLIN